ncbi:MAG: hypothetical protein IJV22_01095 [Bacteroidales bacterium]|nr:hypothetical protein [Bacteroidales bacterium]
MGINVELQELRIFATGASYGYTLYYIVASQCSIHSRRLYTNVAKVRKKLARRGAQCKKVFTFVLLTEQSLLLMSQKRRTFAGGKIGDLQLAAQLRARAIVGSKSFSITSLGLVRTGLCRTA